MAVAPVADNPLVELTINANSYISDKEAYRRERVAQCAKILALAITNPEVGLDPASLAKRTGMSDQRITALLASQDFFDLVVPSLRSIIAGKLIQQVDVIHQIVVSEDSTPSEKIRAHAAFVTTYKTLSETDAGHDRHNAPSAIASILERVKSRKIEIAVEKQPHERKVDRPAVSP